MNQKAARAIMPSLASGQLWQLNDCYVKISRAGKMTVEYKLLRKPRERAMQLTTGNLKDVTAYLKAHRAKLIKAPVNTHEACR